MMKAFHYYRLHYLCARIHRNHEEPFFFCVQSMITKLLVGLLYKHGFMMLRISYLMIETYVEINTIDLLLLVTNEM